MNQEKPDNPGVILPPPAIYLIALILSLGLNYFFPLTLNFLPRLPVVIAGVVLIAVAIFFIVPAFRAFRRAKTNPEPWKPTTAIVTSGIYGISRNPIYVGFTLLYLGAALLLNSLWTVLFLAPVLFVMHVGVIFREEEYLKNKFGEEYLNYQKRVRRWV
jgi:protein-S-isoprenylcysteine O-methyltransferase Ste14